MNLTSLYIIGYIVTAIVGLVYTIVCPNKLFTTPIRHYFSNILIYPIAWPIVLPIYLVLIGSRSK